MSASVDVGIACAGAQFPNWWGIVFGSLFRESQRGIEIGRIIAISSALKDFNKNESVGVCIGPPTDKERNQKTDANRCLIANRFMEGESEWLYMIDDDTVPPDEALTNLLKMEKEFCAGLYFNPRPPNNPIAYFEAADGVGYNPLYDYPAGTMVQVDSVGMGCTLINRSVFEKIIEEHEVYMRPNGSLTPVHKSKICRSGQGYDMKDIVGKEKEAFIDGYLVQKMVKPGEDDNRLWPFFSMEFGRTEDHHFCELARAVGIRPWVDTNIICDHIKPQPFSYYDYKVKLNEKHGLTAGRLEQG